MPDNYLTLAEVKELLETESGKRELNEFQKMATAHAVQFVKTDAKTSRKLVNELMKKNESLIEPVACKIADLMPQSQDELRAILSKEKFDLDADSAETIIESVKKYL
ncbi:MAG: RNA polymerase Rpb4 family protein [Methanobacteriota archaeon]